MFSSSSLFPSLTKGVASVALRGAIVTLLLSVESERHQQLMERAKNNEMMGGGRRKSIKKDSQTCSPKIQNSKKVEEVKVQVPLPRNIGQNPSASPFWGLGA